MSNFTVIEYLDADQLPIRAIPRTTGRPFGWRSPKWDAYVRALEARPGKLVKIASFKLTDDEGNLLKTKGGKGKAYADAYNVANHIHPSARRGGQYVAFRESKFDFETRMGVNDFGQPDNPKVHYVEVYAMAVVNSELRVPPMPEEVSDERLDT
jgi:hypothetical protein